MLSTAGAVYETLTTSFFSKVDAVFKTMVEPVMVTELMVTGTPSAVITKSLGEAVFALSVSLKVKITALPDALTSERTKVGPV